MGWEEDGAVNMENRGWPETYIRKKPNTCGEPSPDFEFRGFEGLGHRWVHGLGSLDFYTSGRD